MPINELLSAGITLMILGMGMVFAFLALLVVMMTVMSRVLAMFETDDLEPATIASPLDVPQSDHTSPQIIAAISAAIRQYRQ